MRVTIALRRWSAVLLGGVLLLGLAACDSGGEVDIPSGTDDCIIPTARFGDGGVGKDGIPALTDPEFIAADEVDFLDGSNRVIGFFVDGIAVAVPHNILWWHEIINFNFSDALRLAVTYCPLTGSSMAFDRAVVGGGEFGVSGLLFQNNLTMYDRTDDESLWQQMNREAGCGPRTRTRLPMFPVVEMTWDGWRALHPDTRVVSDRTGFLRNYAPSGYPYGNYEDPNNGALLFPMQIDGRRLPKERLLGIPDSDGGIAFPFSELDAAGPYQAVHETVAGLALVVFWDRAKEGAMAYRPFAAGQDLTFEARDEGLFDTQTGSRWRLDGLAAEGPLAGEQLEPVAEAYVSFWFAWAAFQPSTRLWEAPTEMNFRLWEGG